MQEVEAEAPADEAGALSSRRGCRLATFLAPARAPKDPKRTRMRASRRYTQYQCIAAPSLSAPQGLRRQRAHSRNSVCAFARPPARSTTEDAKRKRETGDVTDEPVEPAAKVAAVEEAPAEPEAAPTAATEEPAPPSKVPAAAEGDDVPKGTPTPVLGDHVVVAVDVA